MALSGIQIYKMLPQTNCKECGFPTCLAFSMKLAAKQVELSDCPHVTEESKQKLAESSAPPIRLVTLKGKDGEVAVGNEVVLFRHEKKFFNRPGVLIRVADTDEQADITEKVKAADAYVVDYVGLDLKLNGFAVEARSGDAAKFKSAVDSVRKSSKLPLVLISDDPAIIEAGLTLLDGEKPLILGANSENWEAMADVAKKAEAALGVEAGSLEELAELTEKIQGKGVEDLVLHPAVKGMGSSLALQTQSSRATAATRPGKPASRRIRSASTPASWCWTRSHPNWSTRSSSCERTSSRTRRSRSRCCRRSTRSTTPNPTIRCW